MIDQGTISGKIAKSVFLDMLTSGKNAETIVKDKNLVQVSDEGELLEIVREIIVSNPEQVADYRAGKTKLMGFFVGQVMKKSQGKANPQLVNKVLKEKLG